MLNDKQVKQSAGSQPTPRELQVLELICESYTTKQIAALLGVSVKTVACHRHSLMAKADMHDSISLFRWALEKGHIRLGEREAQAGKMERQAPEE